MRDELTARLAGADDPAEVERVISDVLGDPSLRVAFRDGSEWIDVDGRPIDAGAAAGDRGWVALNGERSAALVFDPGLRAQPDRMRVIAGIGAAALERARTEAELRAVRRRLVSVAEDERHRIERNLHDGAQQRLISMSVRVAMARETLASHPEGGPRDPAGVRRRRAAGARRAPRAGARPLSARARRPRPRRGPPLAGAALAGPGRHGDRARRPPRAPDGGRRLLLLRRGAPERRQARRPRRRGSPSACRQDAEGAVVFEVRDDGRGFAVGPLRPGTGLMGMRDRVEAVEGTLTITSAPGAGTWVRGRIPPERSSPAGPGGIARRCRGEARSARGGGGPTTSRMRAPSRPDRAGDSLPSRPPIARGPVGVSHPRSVRRRLRGRVARLPRRPTAGGAGGRGADHAPGGRGHLARRRRSGGVEPPRRRDRPHLLPRGHHRDDARHHAPHADPGRGPDRRLLRGDGRRGGEARVQRALHPRGGGRSRTRRLGVHRRHRGPLGRWRWRAACAATSASRARAPEPGEARSARLRLGGGQPEREHQLAAPRRRPSASRPPG